MTKLDLTYTTNGIFTTFYPESKEGEIAYKTILEHTNNTAKILTIHLKSTLQQLRKVGYKVSKAKPVTEKELED